MKSKPITENTVMALLKFPTDTSKFKEWLKILGKKSKDLKGKPVVCSRHFRFKDYYSGGKRLLPSALPVLRLNNSPKKEKPTTKIRLSEPNKAKSIIRLSSISLRKSVPNLISNKLKVVKKSPQLLKKTSKSDITLKTTKTKLLVRTVPKLNSAKPLNQKLSKTESGKPFNETNVKLNKASDKSASTLLCKRNTSIINKGSQSRHKPPLETTPGRVISDLPNQIKLNFAKLSNNKEDKNLTGKGSNSSCENIDPQSSQLSKFEVNENLAEPKNQTGSDEIPVVTSKSSLDNNSTSETKTTLHEQGRLSIKLKKKASKPEPSCKRPVRKRKRLLSEDESNEDCGKSKPKVQKCKPVSTVVKKESKQSKTNSCSRPSSNTQKNLSGIEKTILEMQNKIQMLERKSILDEKKIETFKKALITQRKTDLQILMDEKENELLLRMDLLYHDYDPHRICRLCLQLMTKRSDLIPLFWPVKNLTLLSLITQATNVEVEPEEGLPSGICEECLEDIRKVDWLKRRTQKSNSLIKKFVNLKKSSTQNNTINLQVTSDAKLKPNDCMSEEEIMNEVKIEDVFSLENSPMTFENIIIKDEHESDESSKVNNKLNTTYSIPVKKDHKPKICGNCNRTFKNRRVMLIHFQYCSKRFQCSECNRCFLNASLFRRHRLLKFSCYCAENLRYCSDCNIGFRWKWQLVFHVLRHSTQSCVLCHETVHSDEHLQRHFNEAHPNKLTRALPNIGITALKCRTFV